MKNRTTLFMVLGLLACLMVTDAPAQCTKNPDGSITCPTLAPPLPPAVAAEAAARSVQEPTITAEGLSILQRRKMGFTRLHAIRAAIKLARQGTYQLPRGLAGEDLAAANAEIKEAIATEIFAENLGAWEEPIADGRFDEFFSALLDFLEQFMPFLLQIFDMINNLSSAILTPTATMADLVPVVGPPVMLAA